MVAKIQKVVGSIGKMALAWLPRLIKLLGVLVKWLWHGCQD